MKRYPDKFWKKVLGDEDLVGKGVCTIDSLHTYLIKPLPRFTYQLTLIQNRLRVLVETCAIDTANNERYSIIIQSKSGDKYANMVTCTFDDVRDIRNYLKNGLLNSHDPKELIDSLRKYYPDHHTIQYKISRKIITTILSDLDLQYSEFHQGVFTFWLRGIKIVVNSEGRHIEVRSIVGDRVLATYAGNEYGLRNLESYYFTTYQEV